MGWRDSATAEAQADLDRLLEVVVEFAGEQIATHRTFLPFAMAVGTDGEMQVVQTDYPQGSDPDATAMLEADLRSLRLVRSSIRAGARAVDVRLPQANEDAIDVVLEHSGGIAIGVTVPYVLTDTTLELGMPSARTEDPAVW